MVRASRVLFVSQTLHDSKFIDYIEQKVNYVKRTETLTASKRATKIRFFLIFVQYVFFTALACAVQNS